MCEFSGKIYLAVSLVYTRQVDFRDEGDLRRDVGVVLAAADLQTVDAVLVHALSNRVSMPALLQMDGEG